MSVSDNNKNRGAHGDSSSMLGWLRPSSENPPALAVGSVKKQTEFCVDLMNRLSADIQDDISNNAWQGVFWHYRKKQDIIRLRRELNALAKILDPYA